MFIFEQLAEQKIIAAMQRGNSPNCPASENCITSTCVWMNPACATSTWPCRISITEKFSPAWPEPETTGSITLLVVAQFALIKK